MARTVTIWRGALCATLFLSSSPVLAKVVYLDPATIRDPSPAQLPDRNAKESSTTVWGQMEDAARRAAEKTGLAERSPAPRANDAIFAQALASQFDLQNDVTIARLLDFRIGDHPGPQEQKAARRRSLIDMLLVSDVPEPATWLYLLCGFGLIGALLRSRRAPDAARRRDNYWLA